MYKIKLTEEKIKKVRKRKKEDLNGSMYKIN